MEINYSGKSVLIVDNKLEDLGALRQILGRMGVENVQVASSVNMALSLMREFRYDLCFAEYDMGKGEKNGLQLLQEANIEKTFSQVSAYFLVVDPQTSELLFGSLEHSPLTFISKPYDHAKIRHRVEKQLRIKEATQQVEQLVDEEKYEEVLPACEKLVSLYPGLGLYLQRVYGIALLRLKRFADANEMFVALTQKRELPWAEVGKGISYYQLGQYDQARDCLTRFVDQQYVCSEAFTWLARAHRAKGEAEHAVTLMRKAVMVQPTVPGLQGELANMAAQCGEWEIAKTAYQNAIRFARYSAYQSPSFYLGQVRALIQIAGGKIDKVEDEVVRVLEDLLLDFPDDQVVRFRAKLINCDLYRGKHDQERLNQMMQQTWNFFQVMELETKCQWLDLMTEAAHDTVLENSVQEKRRELNQGMLEQRWGKANLTGMSLFRKGDVEKAYGLFKEAHLSLPTHTGIALNYVQSAIEKAKRMSEEGRDLLVEAQSVISELDYGALPPKQQQRFVSLNERFVEQLAILDEQTASAADDPDPYGQEL